MAVITVSRKFGCEGGYIAEQAAQKLGYHFVNKEFIGRVFSDYGLIEFDTEYDSLPSFWEKFTAQTAMKGHTVNMLNRVIRTLAHHGNVVILGRSGYVVLGEYADVLNVRIQAPYDFRFRQLMEGQKMRAHHAEALIKENDKIRSEFVKTFYGVQWEDSSGFDLVINTSKIAPALAINWIVEAAQALEAKEADDQPTTASIEVDTILASVVSKELEYDLTHRQ